MQPILEKELIISTLNRKRTIRIYLPFDYEQSTDSYPVIYMHDGQNLFDDQLSYGGKSWGVLNHFNNPGQSQFIVVGIDNGGAHRFNEYSPFPANEYAQTITADFSNGNGCEGSLYMEWVATKLKHYIDTNFRTKADFKNTLLVGSSMGGLISLFGGLQYNTVFGGLGVLSPAFWYCKEDILNYVNQNSNYSGKIFMTVGTKEDGLANSQYYVDDATAMADLLNENNIDYKYLIIKDARHNEASWEELLVDMADYLIAK